GAFGPGLPEPTPSRRAGSPGPAPVNYRALSLASPAGRGRMAPAGTELPGVRAQGKAPAGNGCHCTAGAGPGSLSPACWPDTLVELTTSYAPGTWQGATHAEC